MEIIIKVRTVQGLPQYLVFINNVQSGHVYYTQEAALIKVQKLMAKYSDLNPVNRSEII